MEAYTVGSLGVQRNHHHTQQDEVQPQASVSGGTMQSLQGPAYATGTATDGGYADDGFLGDEDAGEPGGGSAPMPRGGVEQALSLAADSTSRMSMRVEHGGGASSYKHGGSVSQTSHLHVHAPVALQYNMFAPSNSTTRAALVLAPPQSVITTAAHVHAGAHDSHAPGAVEEQQDNQPVAANSAVHAAPLGTLHADPAAMHAAWLNAMLHVAQSNGALPVAPPALSDNGVGHHGGHGTRHHTDAAQSHPPISHRMLQVALEHAPHPPPYHHHHINRHAPPQQHWHPSAANGLTSHPGPVHHQHQPQPALTIVHHAEADGPGVDSRPRPPPQHGATTSVNGAIEESGMHSGVQQSAMQNGSHHQAEGHPNGAGPHPADSTEFTSPSKASSPGQRKNQTLKRKRSGMGDTTSTSNVPEARSGMA